MKLKDWTIGEMLNRRVEKTPQLVCVRHQGQTLTWQEIDRMSDKVAVQFLKKGIVKGSHVGLWGENSSEWISSYLALVKIGALPVLLNICYKTVEMNYALDYADLDALVYGDGHFEDELYDVLKEMDLEAFPKLKFHCHAKTLVTPEELTEEERKMLKVHKKAVTPQDEGTFFFTSGTTSNPKGVIHTHYALVNNARATVKAMRWTESDILCLSVPLFHCFGITSSILASIYSGMSMALVGFYRTKGVLDVIEEEGCTVINGVPSTFLAMCRNAYLKEKPTHTLKSGIIAGSAFTAKEYMAICDYLGMPYLQPSYGQTETAPCVTIADYNDTLEEKANSVGHVIDHVSVDIRNDSGKQTETGEIWVKGYNVMKNGYYKMDLQVKDDNGWLNTGDNGYFDAKGDLHIVGRKSDLIIRGGENISPLEIEVVVKNHPDILEAKAFGVADPVLQEQVALAIVMKKNCPYDEEVVRNHLKGKIANYKIPFYYMHLDEMPRNSTGKINVKALVKKFNMEKINEG
ncbi:MAG: acyl--CoA ligase [Eubacteriaceae bacterium]|jgi:fatty-acyl-CoA synthase|nr:acyl--CoA ligase [Eubacteriaceae bacterium]